MSIPFRKLGEIGDFRNGLNYSKANFGLGLKVISVKDFGDRWRPDLSILDEIDPAGIRVANSDLRAGDILFVRSNGNKELIGRSMLIVHDLKDVSFSGFCIRFRPQSRGVNSRFLSLYFRTPFFRRTLSQQGKGTNINNLNQTILERMEVPWLPAVVQDRIVDIAGAYDDLIENNRRRIALLEEAARLLYREWFVHFRFPGHEHVKITDGLPEGWELSTASAVMEVLSGGTPKTSNPAFWDGEIGFFTPKDATENPFVLETEKTVTEDGLRACNSKLYPSDVIFITARGTVGKLNLALVPMAMNQSCYALQSKTHLGQRHLFLALKSAIEQVRARATGSVFDSIIVATFDRIPFILPPRQQTDIFALHIEPIFDQIANLAQQNKKLAQARDLLLPHLMNGEIAV